MEKLTIVGGGLVGSLTALVLAKRGFQVEVFERRRDMRKEIVDRGRSINLAVSVRGLFALKQVGLEETVLERAIPMVGRMVHPLKGPVNLQPYGKDASEHINSVSRAALNEILLNAAEKTGQVSIRFNERVEGIEFGSSELLLKNETTGVHSRHGIATVFGTDGSASAIRSEMVRMGALQAEESMLEYGYKELSIPAGEDGRFLLEKNALHIWPRRTFMLIALPNEDGSFTCTLFLPFEGESSFANLHSHTEVRTFFEQNFADTVPLMSHLNEEFFANPTGNMVTVRSFPWSIRSQVLLIGDAAHAIVPFFGQGMNCGFEDVTELDRLMGVYGAQWKLIFSEFEQKRKPNTDAIAEMALENFIEMRDKVSDPKFLLAKEVEKILQVKFPKYISRYSLVTFSRVPYSVALEAGRIQNEILKELCHGISHAGEVNLLKAKALIEERLLPVIQS